jgi:uncharacterized membrane protein
MIMKAKIALYNSHEEALQAIQKLKDEGFSVDKVSLVGKAEIIDDHMHVYSLENVKNAPVTVGAIAGPVIGLLSGIGIFAIPGFGFIYGAGAILGAIAGLNLGVVGGGIITLLLTLGIEKENLITYEQHVMNGKFLVVVNGSMEEIHKAEKIIDADKHPVEIS